MSQQKSLFAKNERKPITRTNNKVIDMSEEKTVNRLFLQDGNHGMHRAKHGYGKRMLTNGRGENVTIVYGFLQQLGADLQQFEPTHVCCVFDGENAKMTRRAIYPEYKANRDNDDDSMEIDGQNINFFQQQVWIRAILLSMGFHVACTAGVEGDDMLGSAVHRFSPEAKILVGTRDKDMMGLVKLGVRIWDAQTKTMFDRKQVFKHFGVRPDQMVDYLCLLGDKIDNIPGCPGMGPVFARELLAEFGTVNDFMVEAIQLSKSGKLDKRHARIFKMVAPWYEDKMGYRLAHKLITLMIYDMETEGRPVTLEDWRIGKPNGETEDILQLVGIRNMHPYFKQHLASKKTKAMFRGHKL